MGLVNSASDLRDDEINYLDFWIPSDDPERASHDFTNVLQSFKFHKKAAAVEYFIQLLIPILSGDYILVPMPSSSAGYTDTGLHRLVRKLAARSPRLLDGTSCLVRHKSIWPAHKGGKRDKYLHKTTMTAQKEAIPGSTAVILLDDILTTGNSMEAGRELLLAAGAAKVLRLALGRTHRSHLRPVCLESLPIPLLGLYRMQGIGRATIHKLLRTMKEHDIRPERYDNIIDVFRLLQAQDKRVTVPTKRELIESADQADGMKNKLIREGVRIIELGARDYPHRLSVIDDAPVVLFVMGDYKCLHTDGPVAVVGSRKATLQGLEAAKEFAGFFATKQRTVVSGLAFGCDTAAHKGCLEAGGKTVAVLAHGLDMVFPSENEALAREITEKGGCLVSEYLPDQKPMNYTFVERDRIQSGLSNGVIVVESDLKGGSMHTARYCLAQGRKLGCLEYSDKNLDSEMTLGNEKLIAEDGAMPLKDVQDLEKFNELLNETDSKNK